MYISGNIGSFQSRLHQLPTTLVDLSGSVSGFLQEGRLYVNAGQVSSGWVDTINKEYKAKYYEITKTGITGHYFF